MATFQMDYKNYVNYAEKVELTINTELHPEKEDYQKLLDAIDVLDNFAKKYLKQEVPVKALETRE